jgi:hypothetical protein
MGDWCLTRLTDLPIWPKMQIGESGIGYSHFLILYEPEMAAGCLPFMSVSESFSFGWISPASGFLM